MLSITQGAQSVQFIYDSAGRPATVTWPNGMVATYSYDAGSHLSEIAYSLNQVTIGNLTYTYDALNRRTGVGGSLAATALPLALTSATYDAANQLATWNGTTFSYDANGSLVSDGQNTYTWNARGQLAGISGTLNAAFAYDAFGRRIAKTVGANALGFVYDGGGGAQELTGSTVTASIWSGGSNGFVQRTDSAGTVAPLTDAQGSVIALADSSGNLLTRYYYDPFGNTVAGGLSSSNEFQYIGRENDFNGLYYMHARYYSPAIGRFVSEDPLGFGGADVNLHAYTFGSPTNLRDPNGTNPFLVACAVGATVDVGMNLFADYYTGRKSRWQDAFSWATLRYAGEGCVSGLEGAIFGEFVLAPVIDMAAPLVAKVFTEEASAAAGDAAGADSFAAVPQTAGQIGIAGEEAVSDTIGVPRNVGPGQVTVPGTGAGGYRVPDFDPDLTIPSRGTVVEVKNVQQLQISDQIRDLANYANSTRGVPLEIFTNGSLSKFGELFNLIQSGQVIISPIP